MTLIPVEFEPVADEAAAEVVAFISDAGARVSAFFASAPRRSFGFVPSDYGMVCGALRALRRIDGDARRFCEWGSGLGVVVGIGELLGYEAHGIEVDADLVAMSRSLLADHGLRAQISHGSFVPEDYARSERFSDSETKTVLSEPDVYGDSDLEIEDFDVIFAYPWPSEEAQYCDLFEHYADYGAVLLLHSLSEGVRVFRKRVSQRP